MQPTDVETVIPLVEERLHIDKRVVETDRVRVRSVVDERRVLVEDILQTGRLDVTRVPVDRAVSEAPPPRQEGDTHIISLVEERLVVEKRLFVIEELHVRHVVEQENVSIPGTVRTMRAVVERDDLANTTTNTGRI